MEDPPPEDPSGLPPPAAVSPLLSQPELAGSAMDGVSSDQPLPHVEPSRPPLAELHVNGELLSGKGAASKKMPLNRPSTGAPRLKIMKKKSNSKLLHYHLLPHGDAMQKNLMEEVGRAAVVQPLQSVAVLDTPFEGDDDEWSDEEEEEDFDLESFQFDETRRAELASLMERYEVYDEEQLRLAIRRERKQQKIGNVVAGEPSLSPESAPVSPSGKASGFIPPCGLEYSPRSSIILPRLQYRTRLHWMVIIINFRIHLLIIRPLPYPCIHLHVPIPCTCKFLHVPLPHPCISLHVPHLLVTWKSTST